MPLPAQAYSGGGAAHKGPPSFASHLAGIGHSAAPQENHAAVTDDTVPTNTPVTPPMAYSYAVRTPRLGQSAHVSGYPGTLATSSLSAVRA